MKNMKIRDILFPVDFSPRCDAMAHTVAGLAKKTGARVHLLHAVQLPDGPADFAPMRAHFLTAAEELRGGLASYQAELFAGVAREDVLKIGRPALEITDYAHVAGVDLVMMPTRGFSPFRQLLLGSVTGAVLHDVECAVWTGAHVVGDGEEGPGSGGGRRNLVCAIDGGPGTGRVVEAAIAVGEIYAAPVYFVHAGDTAATDVLTGQLGLTVEPAAGVGGGGVAAAVLASVARHAGDLLIIGRGRAHGTLGRLRSNAYDLIRHAPCPVLSV